MATPFLQGLTKAMDMLEHDLETQAQGLMRKIEHVGACGKVAMEKGHVRIDGVAGRIAEVDKFVSAIEGSNGGGPLSDSSTPSVTPPAAVSASEPVTEAAATPAPATVTEPEHLSVNGVSQS